MTATTFVTASANPHKVEEIAALMAELLPEVRLLPRPSHVPDVVENADTLLGNARLKAQALALATGLPAIADDTGLFVEALKGQPGVHTARYAGENATYTDNCDKLLHELGTVGAVADAQRNAHFATVAIVAWPDGREIYAEGIVTGTIAHAYQGTGGFGYDPLFRPDGFDGQTFSELGPAVKNAISHRARAFSALAELLRAHMDSGPLPTA